MFVITYIEYCLVPAANIFFPFEQKLINGNVGSLWKTDQEMVKTKSLTIIIIGIIFDLLIHNY